MSMQSVTVQPPFSPATTASTTAGNNQVSPVRSSAGERVAAVEPGRDQPIRSTNPTEQRQQLEEAVQAVKEFIQPMAGNLEFSLDEDTGTTVIKIIDASTKELIRQIPSKEMLEIAQALDRLQGLLVHQKA